MIYPFWSPLSYLKRVANNVPEQVVDILVDIPETDNPRVLQEICEIACDIENIELSLKLKPWFTRYIKSPHKQIGLYDLIVKIVNRWIGGSKDSLKAALELSKIVVSFRADSMSEEKQAHRLELSPRFEEWEYQQILEKGIRPLCEKEPYLIARILIDATTSVIRLSRHRGYLNREEDSSEIWCPRLNQSDQNYLNTKEMLVHTLAFACEKVYEKSPESIEALDQTLRNQQWKVFKRLRQHLYALNPNKQTLSWIREFILQYKYYDKWEYDYGYEFQQMIRTACEHFGARLLDEEERATIFDAILSTPSREEFLKRMGDQFTEEGLQQWQRGFHRKKLQPFARLLAGEYQSYFHELKDGEEKPLSDEDYSPVGQWGKVSYRSPSSLEDLARLGDEELLTYINTWQEERPWYEEHRYEDEQWIEINIGALADAFRTVFKDTIIPNEERLAFWLENRDRIERPVYVRAIVRAIQEHVKEQHYERLELWFEFCEWVLSHSDAKRDHGERGDESREHSDWGSSRRAVGDFIGECLKEEMNVPFTARESLANIFRLLCTQFDRRLDLDEPTLLNRNDQITEAINNTRSRALQDLVKFGFWVRRYDNTDSVPEVTSILEERFKKGAEYPLTRPERAVIGMCYGSICSLNQSWAAKYKTIFFPQDDLPSWIEAFGGFLCLNSPFKPTFEILKDDFALVLNHLADLKKIEVSIRELPDMLGQHLFAYYLWEVYPLKGEDSLLEKFYEKTTEDRQRWANLFDHAGRSLRNSGKHLEEGLRNRIVAFFNWRFKVREPEELKEFTFWLEAECLDPDWRLDTYAKILDVGQPDDWSISIALDMLNEMLESHTAKVVKCFIKMVDAINQGERIYIDTDKAKPILKAGLNSKDESICENAERAQENLLRAGYSSFLDI